MLGQITLIFKFPENGYFFQDNFIDLKKYLHKKKIHQTINNK